MLLVSECLLLFSILFLLSFELFSSYDGFYFKRFNFVSSLFFVCCIFFSVIFVCFRDFFNVLELKYVGLLFFSGGLNAFQVLFVFYCCFWLFFLFDMIMRRHVFFSLYFVLILLLLLFGFVLLKTLDLFCIFLMLEMQNILLLGFLSLFVPGFLVFRQSFHYFLLSAFFSGFMLLGITFVYFSIGSLNMLEIFLIFKEVFNHPPVILGFSFFFFGFVFKLGLFPFFFWVPEVFCYSPFMGLIPLMILAKIVYIGLFFSCLNFLFFIFRFLLFFVLFGSVFFGLLFALREHSLRRLFGYSTVVQTGFLLFGFIPGDLDAVTSILFFFFVYLFNSFFIFFFLFVFERRFFFEKIFNISDLMGLSFFQSFFFYIFSFSLFSLAGIPPFPGFFSKLYVILSLVQQAYFFLSIFLIFISIFIMFYYIRLVSLVFLPDILGLFRGEFFFSIVSFLFLVFFCLISFFFIFFYHDIWLFCTFFVLFI